MSRKVTITMKIRNPVARSPLLRKGGAHVESKTGQRVRARLATNTAIDEWLDEREQDDGSESGEPLLPGKTPQTSASKSCGLLRYDRKIPMQNGCPCDFNTLRNTLTSLSP